MSGQPEQFSPRLGRGGRWLSALELLFGGAIVLGHNLYDLVPNEVPILFVLGWLSVRIRNGRWAAIGFKRPPSWMRIVGIALAAAAFRIVLGSFVIEPLGARFWPAIQAPAGAEQIAGNLKVALLGLLLVWTFAAFGEEIAYRGYLTLRGAEAGGGSNAAFWWATLLVSVLFGFGHFYKGPTGILDSTVAGLILGAAFFVSGRNLWAAVLVHGFINPYAVVALFFGWESCSPEKGRRLIAESGAPFAPSTRSTFSDTSSTPFWIASTLGCNSLRMARSSFEMLSMRSPCLRN